MTIAAPLKKPAMIAPNRLAVTLLPLLGAFFYFAGTGPNTGLAVLALGVLVAGGYLLWRPGEPPILLAVFGYQWLGAALGIFYSNLMDIPINEFSLWGGQTDRASLLSCVGMLFLGVGMRMGAGPRLQQIVAKAPTVAASRPVSSWFKLYIASFVLAAVALEGTQFVPGLAQPLLAIANLKWACYFALAYATLSNKNAPNIYLIGVFLFEFVLGIGGFFSDFRTVLFFTLFALLTSGVRLRPRALIGIGALMVFMLVLAVAWSGVKTSYRQFVSGGDTENQVLAVGYGERMTELTNLIENMDKDAWSLAVTQFVHRMAYVDFFGVVLDNVPSVIPHENGALWLDALSRPITPRILFPGKTVIDDTARTNHYTNGAVYVSDATSVSIGYMGESYIDFGKIGMMIPILLLGWLFGRIYRWQLTNRSFAGPLGMGFACSILIVSIALESSITKSFGGLVAASLMVWLAGRFIVPRYFPWVLIYKPYDEQRA